MRMRVLTTEGVREIDVPDPIDRSIVGQHWNAIQMYMDKGIERRLRIFQPITIEGWGLESDPDAVDAWWALGLLDFLEIYEG